jgi:hypothetical protein
MLRSGYFGSAKTKVRFGSKKIRYKVDAGTVDQRAKILSWSNDERLQRWAPSHIKKVDPTPDTAQSGSIISKNHDLESQPK